MENEDIKPDVLNYDDIRRLVPWFDGREKLVNRLLHWLQVDKCNKFHRWASKTPGPEFSKKLLFDELHMKVKIDGEEVLDNLPEGAFITVSNHPYGALDGVALIWLIGSRRPKFRVMVNMILNQIGGLRPNFIAVDAWSSPDPAKRQQSVNGIRQTLRQLHNGEPMGFFPAGAMSKVNWRGRLQDREWQKSVLQIIKKAKVPVIPIFFHGGNSWWCNFLGVTFWQARSLRLPAEVFNKRGKRMHISVGDPISVETQNQYATPEELGAYLREKTYELRNRK